jgi:AcrR family transcriptional regulator
VYAPGVTPLRTARDRAHADVRAAILDAARARLAIDGPVGLSLRAVARDLDVVPSALYRYFRGRDAILTALIVEAYDSLGDAAEAAVAAVGRSPRRRWVAAAVAVRSWALEHPHEYALLYGTPVPGYAAPPDTVDPGTRVSRLLVGIVHAAAVAPPALPGTVRLSRELRAELRGTVDLVAPGLPVESFFAVLLAWTQLFGMVSFEVFGQTRGIVTAHEALFESAAEHAAALLGM